jgi:hypothetical protein
MAEQVEKPEGTKREDEIVSNATAKEANRARFREAVEKATFAERSCDRGSSHLFKVK